MPIFETSIGDFRQFQNLKLDFRDPATGKPLEKVCFIGSNGTGKSTLLRMMVYFAVPKSRTTQFFAEDDLVTVGQYQSTAGNDHVFEPIPAIFCPPDADFGPDYSFLHDVNLSNALSRLQENWGEHVELINQSNTRAFWGLLIAKIKERESLYLKELERQKSSSTSIKEFAARFDEEHPKILDKLADLWDRILERAGLEFDIEKASLPVQLTDRFNAYIRLKSTKQQLPWESLSTGIRHYLFRLGHIYTCLFERAADGGALFVDEPEGSLHPDFLYDLVANYQEAAPGMQLFMATHSPIIAAQFRPEERFILEFRDDGTVSAQKGVSPEGDDPNDVLKRDFKVRNLYGVKGLEMWERFLTLGRQIKREADPLKRNPLINEYLTIGRSYDFAPENALPL